MTRKILPSLSFHLLDVYETERFGDKFVRLKGCDSSRDCWTLIVSFCVMSEFFIRFACRKRSTNSYFFIFPFCRTFTIFLATLVFSRLLTSESFHLVNLLIFRNYHNQQEFQCESSKVLINFYLKTFLVFFSADPSDPTIPPPITRQQFFTHQLCSLQIHRGRQQQSLFCHRQKVVTMKSFAL